MKDARFEIRTVSPLVGDGLFALTDIKKKDFILEYTGNRIPTKEADDHPGKYLFEIDRKVTIDGAPLWNDARWINHSCDPNTEAEIEEGDDGQDHVNIYCVRPIKKGEEVTIDYGDEYFDEFIRPHGCQCGSPKCRSLKKPKAKAKKKKKAAVR